MPRRSEVYTASVKALSRVFQNVLAYENAHEVQDVGLRLLPRPVEFGAAQTRSHKNREEAGVTKTGKKL
jgi:hypothetical protein